MLLTREVLMSFRLLITLVYHFEHTFKMILAFYAIELYGKSIKLKVNLRMLGAIEHKTS
jgi:hypothetical protein